MAAASAAVKPAAAGTVSSVCYCAVCHATASDKKASATLAPASASGEVWNYSVLNELIVYVRAWAQNAVGGGTSGGGGKKKNKQRVNADPFIADLLFVACGVRTAACVELPIAASTLAQFLDSLRARDGCGGAVFRDLRSVHISDSASDALFLVSARHCGAAIERDTTNDFADKQFVNAHASLTAPFAFGPPPPPPPPVTASAVAAIADTKQPQPPEQSQSQRQQLTQLLSKIGSSLVSALRPSQPSIVDPRKTSLPAISIAAESNGSGVECVLSTLVGWLCEYPIIYCLLPTAAAAGGGSADSSRANCLASTPLTVYTLHASIRHSALAAAANFAHSYFLRAELPVCSFSVPTALLTPPVDSGKSQSPSPPVATVAKRVETRLTACSACGGGSAGLLCPSQLFASPLRLSSTAITLTSVAL